MGYSPSTRPRAQGGYWLGPAHCAPSPRIPASRLVDLPHSQPVGESSVAANQGRARDEPRAPSVAKETGPPAGGIFRPVCPSEEDGPKVGGGSDHGGRACEIPFAFGKAGGCMASSLSYQIIFPGSPISSRSQRAAPHPNYKYLPTGAPFATIRTPTSSPISGRLPCSDFGRHSSETMAGTIVVFDFDKTIIDCDSDNWVVGGLGATELFERLLSTMPWNTLMDRMMAELHARGKSIEDIADVLRSAPLDPHIIAAIKSAHALGCELRIVSDANVFFIETILKHQGLIGYFSEINTNPSYIDEEGKLRIFPYHDFNKSSHGCPLCPPNMCKGVILGRIRASVLPEGKKRFIYLGDGKGDYCPSLKLTEGDYVMPRKKFPLWERISDDPALLKAEVHEWSNGEELERVLLQLIDKSLLVADGNAASQLLSVDCKLETIPRAAHEPLPQALPVPH